MCFIPMTLNMLCKDAVKIHFKNSEAFREYVMHRLKSFMSEIHCYSNTCKVASGSPRMCVFSKHFKVGLKSTKTFRNINIFFRNITLTRNYNMKRMW